MQITHITRLSFAAVALALTVAACSGGDTTPSSSGAASGCPTSQPAAAAAGTTRDVTMVTSKGTIVLRLSADLSPIAVGNFLALVDCGYYNSVIFHRIVPGFVIQGGDPQGTGMGGPGYSIKDEPVIGSYQRGTLAMARTAAPDSQGSQFFIVLDDAAAGPLESARTYAILGEVVSGLDVVDVIAAVERDSGDRPIDPVTIISATSGPSAP
ncbi:MAG: peptidylprolyl isomerase [Candidatus Limnocylindrus sp.]